MAECNEPCVNGIIPRIDPGLGGGCYALKSGSVDTFSGLESLNSLSLRPNLKFSDPYIDQSLMDPGYCIKHCIDYLFGYAGLGLENENVIGCRCGNETVFQSYNLVDSSFCNLKCTFATSSGNVTYPCGGNGALTIYKAEISGYRMPDITIEKKLEIMNDLENGNVPRYRGCIKDRQYCGQRALNGKCIAADNHITIESCTDFCRKGSFQFAGLEAGNQCFCSNNFNEIAIGLLVGSEHCSSSCRGNSSQICGGSWAVSVYDVSPMGLPKGSSDLGLKIGLGVGIPAFVILISFCIYFTLRRC